MNTGVGNRVATFVSLCIGLIVALPFTFNVRAQLRKIVAKKDECKALGTSAQEEPKLACASIPENFGAEFSSSMACACFKTACASTPVVSIPFSPFRMGIYV